MKEEKDRYNNFIKKQITNNKNIEKENNIEATKGNKRKIKNKKIAIIIALVVIVIYMLYAVYMLVKQPTDKFTVEKGTVYSEETNVGYIIREEQVVKGNNYKNGMEQIKSEGEKTAKGESIYRYYSKNEDNLTKQIADLDTKIQEALDGQSSINNYGIKVSDIKLIETQLDGLIEVLNKTTDISKMSEYKKEINTLITKKAKSVGEQSKAGTYLKELYNQRTKLEQQLNSGAEYITAPVSGIVSYKVDGLEEKLTSNNFSTLSKNFLEGLNIKTGQLIATNDECGKIINNFSCYIATVSNSEEAQKCTIGNKVKVRLSNNKVIPAKIAYISQENDDETLLVLEINEQIEELTNYRKISFDLIWWSYSGLKIPNDAIVEEDGLKYVVRNRAGYYSKILINVEKTNKKYSIVSNYDTDELTELGFSKTEITNMKKLSIYDEIMIKPDLSKVE